MSRLFYHVMQDNLGNLLFGVSGTMRLAGTGTAATIYGDEALTVPLPNPMTNHPSFGSFKCYLGAGAYDFYMAKAGYTFETLTGLQGWGSMALQNHNAVAITGGQAAFTSNLSVAGTTQLNNLGIHQASAADRAINILYQRASEHGLALQGTADTGPGNAAIFNTALGATVGSIAVSSVATAYNTSSDARLKHAVDDLTGELDVIQALRPVRFVWNVDGSPGVGFLAQEVAEILSGVVTGEQGAVDEEGGILPQMIDYSKLVPFLTGAVKTLAAQVEALTARIAVLEDAVGV